MLIARGFAAFNQRNPTMDIYSPGKRVHHVSTD